jgi:hypothetical protein
MWRCLIPLAMALSVVACGSGSGRRAPTSDTSALSHPAIAALPKGSRLLLEVPQPLSAGYAAGGSLYYSDTSPLGEHTGEIYRMTRVNLLSGRSAATRRFSGALDDMLLTSGSLWVTTSTGNVTSLWRLDPRSLAVRSKATVPSSPYTEEIAGSLAAAGGHLWVGAGTLDQVSLATGRVDRVVTPNRRGPVQLAADRTGRTLLAVLGYEHPTYVARLNPNTGTPLAEIAIPRSVSQPTVGGIVDGGAWLENTIGTQTTTWRINAETLKATNTSARSVTNNRISVRVMDGVLWVTHPLRSENLNYCADPVTGRPLAQLPPLRGDSVLLTADATNIFYTDLPVNGHSIKLETAPISLECTS